MITIFNRKELLITMDMNQQSNVRNILSANGVDYTTKVLSVVILLHITVALICKSKNLWKGVRLESAITSIISLMPVAYGFESYSGVGFAITILLVTLFYLSNLNKDVNR